MRKRSIFLILFPFNGSKSTKNHVMMCRTVTVPRRWQRGAAAAKLKHAYDSLTDCHIAIVNVRVFRV